MTEFTMSIPDYFDAFDDIDELKKAAKIIHKDNLVRLESLEKAVAILRESNGFYANEDNYYTIDRTPKINSPICDGCGKRAREAERQVREMGLG